MEWFIKIPNAILQDKELSHTEMILYGYIEALSNNKEKKCFATNQALWELIGRSKKTITPSLSTLKTRWYIDIEDDKLRKIIPLLKNKEGVLKNKEGGAKKLAPYKDKVYIDNNKLLSNSYSDLYNSFYWKDKWIDETVCDKLINAKLENWITLDDIKIWMMLYNTECRIKQEYRYVKKFETWIKEFQPLTEEQIEETLTRLIRQHKEKIKSDPKYTKWILAKTVWNDLCSTFWKDRVNGIFKRESSSETILNFT